MQTVIETHSYLADAKASGMTEAERIGAVNTVSFNPVAGDLIVGSGGCRKVRIAGRGKGKSGGYRVITFYAGDFGVFLLTVFGKGERANLSKKEIVGLAKLTSALVASLKAPEL